MSISLTLKQDILYIALFISDILKCRNDGPEHEISCGPGKIQYQTAVIVYKNQF